MPISSLQMDSNNYEMDPSSPIVYGQYLAPVDNSVHNYTYPSYLPSQFPVITPDDPPMITRSHHWFQGNDFRPHYLPGMETGLDRNPMCEFRSDIVDDCAKSRLYVATLEYYMFENESRNTQTRCLLATCPRQFNNPKDMVIHLKKCKKYACGVFWCPTCRRYESFRNRSSRRCSWDREHLGPVVRQKSREILRVFTGACSGTPQTPNCGLCSTCQARMHGIPAQHGHYEGTLAQPKPAIANGEWHEMPLTDCTPELSENPDRSQAHRELGYVHRGSISELSSSSTNSHGDLADANISPPSSTYTERPAVAGQPNPGSTSGGLNPHVAVFGGTFDTGDYMSSPRVTNHHGINETIFGGMSPGPAIGSLTPNATAALPTYAPSSARHLSLIGLPGLTLDTIPDTPVTAVLPPSVEVSPSNAFPTQQNNASMISPVSSTQHSLSTSVSSVSDSQTSSPRSPTSPDGEPKCPKCGFRPSGKPESLKAYLRKHIKHKHDPNLIPCDVCKKTFTRRDNLTTHLKRSHTISDVSSPKRRRGSSGGS